MRNNGREQPDCRLFLTGACSLCLSKAQCSLHAKILRLANLCTCLRSNLTLGKDALLLEISCCSLIRLDLANQATFEHTND